MNEQVVPAQPEIKEAGDGVINVNGAEFMQDAGGRLVPLALVKPQRLLEDQTVRKILGYAEKLSAEIRRFRGHTSDDVTTFIETLAEEYGASRGGAKGNVTLTSFDGLLKVTVQVQDLLTFGPELKIAKSLVDECITAWAEGANDKVRVLVDYAFQVDKEGRINRSALFQLRSLDIEDDTWRTAMDALTDAIRVIGSKEYVRFYSRKKPGAPWQAVTIDLAAA